MLLPSSRFHLLGRSALTLAAALGFTVALAACPEDEIAVAEKEQPVLEMAPHQMCLEPRMVPKAPGSTEMVIQKDVVQVTVRPQGECFSSSCTRGQRTECSVNIEGRTVRVSAKLLYSPAPSDAACTADCGGGPVATCSTPPLGSGDWTFLLEHEGGKKIEVKVPKVPDQAVCRPAT